MSGNDGFLSRWSARKQAARETVADAPEVPVEPVAEPDPEKSDAELLEELGLRDPDTMEPGDDFSAFMGSGIPERLRNRALRKLWLTNPVLANLDDLVEYGEDYTDAATVVENLQTAYRVGKGFLRQEELDAAEEEAPDSAAADDADDVDDAVAAAPEAADEDPADASFSPDGIEDREQDVDAAAVDLAVNDPVLPAVEPMEQELPRRRRMVFRPSTG